MYWLRRHLGRWLMKEKLGEGRSGEGEKRKRASHRNSSAVKCSRGASGAKPSLSQKRPSPKTRPVIPGFCAVRRWVGPLPVCAKMTRTEARPETGSEVLLLASSNEISCPGIRSISLPHLHEMR